MPLSSLPPEHFRNSGTQHARRSRLVRACSWWCVVLLAIAATLAAWKLWPVLRMMTTGLVSRPTLEQVADASRLRLPAGARLVGCCRRWRWQTDVLHAAIDLPSTHPTVFLRSLEEWDEAETGSVAGSPPAFPLPWWRPGAGRALGESVRPVEAGGVAFMLVEHRPSGGTRVFITISW